MRENGRVGERECRAINKLKANATCDSVCDFSADAVRRVAFAVAVAVAAALNILHMQMQTHTHTNARASTRTAQHTGTQTHVHKQT